MVLVPKILTSLLWLYLLVCPRVAVDPEDTAEVLDQMPQYVASDRGLHCLQNL